MEKEKIKFSVVVKNIFKVAAAGVVALVFLNLFAMLYYNVPVRVENQANSTDYKWKANDFYMRGSEGFTYGRTDANGYNNVEVVEKPDVLIMGSSQMEAMNVLQDQSTAYKLGELFKENNVDMSVYNIGTSGHFKERCFNNLENAVEEYEPGKYVVLQLADADFTIEDLKKLESGDYKRLTTVEKGVVYELQKIDYLRLVYSKLEKVLKVEEAEASAIEEADKKEYEEYIDRLLERSVSYCGERKLIVLYSDCLVLNDGKIEERNKDFYYNALKQACENNGAVFIDMYDDYLEYYEKYNILPNGFSNTKVGSGHLNKYGHRVIAQRLYDVIMKMEVAK